MIGKKMIALAAVAVGALALVAVDTIPVDARGGHGGGGGGGGGGGRGGGGGGHSGGGGGGVGARSFSGGGGGGGGRVVFRSAPAFRSAGVVHHRAVRYAPVRVYSYGYGSCEALHHRALVTGSRYWWQRYYDCRGYY